MKSKFAITTVIGLVGGIACVAIAIMEAGNLSLFVNIPSLLIIVGGTTFALILSYPGSTLKKFGRVMKQAFTNTDFDLIQDINTIVELSETARREGILALENYSENCEDRFLKRALSMLIDGTDKEDIEASLMNEIYHAHRRHLQGASMISMIAQLAPALGLVGTYVGLIPMLVEMNDPDKLGPLMAIELVSSFYGGFLAYVIFAPLAKKLISFSSEEKNRNELLLEGILAIQEGKNPRLIREDLTAYLTYDQLQMLPSFRNERASDDQSSRNVIDYEKSKSSKRGA